MTAGKERCRGGGRERGKSEGRRGEDKNVVKKKSWRRDKGREDEL